MRLRGAYAHEFLDLGCFVDQRRRRVGGIVQQRQRQLVRDRHEPRRFGLRRIVERRREQQWKRRQRQHEQRQQ